MTILHELPQELERAVRRRAHASGREVGPWLVEFLQDTVATNESIPASAVPRLEPTEYPVEDMGDEFEYQPVEMPIVGTTEARFVAGGLLTPPRFPGFLQPTDRIPGAIRAESWRPLAVGIAVPGTLFSGFCSVLHACQVAVSDSAIYRIDFRSMQELRTTSQNPASESRFTSRK